MSWFCVSINSSTTMLSVAICKHNSWSLSELQSTKTKQRTHPWDYQSLASLKYESDPGLSYHTMGIPTYAISMAIVVAMKIADNGWIWLPSSMFIVVAYYETNGQLICLFPSGVSVWWGWFLMPWSQVSNQMAHRHFPTYAWEACRSYRQDHQLDQISTFPFP